MTEGRFGPFGGQYIPETLMNEIHRLEKAYNFYKHDAAFQAELKDLLDNYANRPSLLYYAKKMTEDLGGAKIYLKREDLNHTGAHKINNALGQIGIDVEIVALDAATNSQALKVEHNFDIYTWGISATNGDIDYANRFFYTDNANNIFGYSDPEMDALI